MRFVLRKMRKIERKSMIITIIKMNLKNMYALLCGLCERWEFCLPNTRIELLAKGMNTGLDRPQYRRLLIGKIELNLLEYGSKYGRFTWQTKIVERRKRRKTKKSDELIELLHKLLCCGLENGMLRRRVSFFLYKITDLMKLLAKQLRSVSWSNQINQSSKF